MVNGYVTLDLASKNIYKEALGAIKAGKPVMVVDAPDVYFADSIKATTIDDDVVVQITKGGKIITVNDANAVSSTGTINKQYVNIKIETDRCSYYFNAHLNVPFETNKELTMNSDIFKFLDDNKLIYRNVVEEDNDEFVAVLYDVNDSEIFKIDTRYLDNGSITQGEETISKITFKLI